MFKFKSILFTLLAAGVLMSLSSAMANAQNYVTPTSQATANARRTGPCSDPWVTIAIIEVTGISRRSIAGVGEFGQCNTALYNGGSWSSYPDLANAVHKVQQALSGAGVSFQMTSLGGGQAQIKVMDGGTVADKMTVQLISANSGKLISQDGGTLVASGGGNHQYSVQSTSAEKRINLGKSVLIIKKR